MLDAGVDLRDVQIAARHADPRTTMRYDRARKNLDRHPNYILAAYMAASGTCSSLRLPRPGPGRHSALPMSGGVAPGNRPALTWRRAGLPRYASGSRG